VKIVLDYPRLKRFKCVKCGICCGDTLVKTRHILLLETEAFKISSETAKAIPEFATRVEDKEPYRYEMVKTTKEGMCIFLKKNRCMIYALRPLVCRFYPFELRTTRSRKHKFTFTDECIGLGQGLILQEDFFRDLLCLAQDKMNK